MTEPLPWLEHDNQPSIPDHLGLARLDHEQAVAHIALIELGLALGHRDRLQAAEYLGHAAAGFTLRTYTHMMPASEDRMRKAVDRALGATVDRFSRALDVPSGGG